MEPIPPTQPLAEPITAPETPKSKFLLWVLGGILLLGVGVVAGVLLSKHLYSKPTLLPTPSPAAEVIATPNPTANWKTYSNTQHNFRFKHPNLDDLTNTIGIAGPQDTTNLKPVVQFANKSTIMPGTDAAFDGFAVYVVPNPQKYTLSQYVNSQKQSLTTMFKQFRGSDYNDQTLETSLTVGNQQAILFTNTGDHVDRVYVSFPNNQQFLVIGKVQLNNNNTFDQILSTFKFLDQTTDTSNWKTYQSTNNDVAYTSDWSDFQFKPGVIAYEFRYPTDWILDSGVFSDSKGNKVAEILPGAVSLAPGQTCFDRPYNNFEGRTELVSQGNINIAGLQGVRRIEKVSVTYCLVKNNEAFEMVFYADPPTSEKQKSFDQILSTFQFTN